MMLSSSMDQKEQVRVSKKAVKKGLDFATVGNLMIQRYKEEFQAKHVQILFITRELPVMDQLIAQGKRWMRSQMHLTIFEKYYSGLRSVSVASDLR